jgi:hypothetical protein
MMLMLTIDENVSQFLSMQLLFTELDSVPLNGYDTSTTAPDMTKQTAITKQTSRIPMPVNSTIRDARSWSL